MSTCDGAAKDVGVIGKGRWEVSIKCKFPSPLVTCAMAMLRPGWPTGKRVVFYGLKGALLASFVPGYRVLLVDGPHDGESVTVLAEPCLQRDHRHQVSSSMMEPPVRFSEDRVRNRFPAGQRVAFCPHYEHGPSFHRKGFWLDTLPKQPCPTQAVYRGLHEGWRDGVANSAQAFSSLHKKGGSGTDRRSSVPPRGMHGSR